MTKKFLKANIKFKVDGKPIEFSVYHNLPQIRGLSIKDAVVNWSARTKKYTDKSLCKYIMKKQTGYCCFTQSQLDNM